MRISALLLLFATGCAERAYVPPPRSDGPEPAFTMRVDDKLGDGVRIERLVVVLDGALLYQRVMDHRWTVPQTIAAMDLPQGDHTMQMLVVTSAPCGLLESPRWKMELRTSRSFTVTRRAVRMRVTLTTRGPTAQPNDLLQARVEERLGGWIAPGAYPMPIEPAPAHVHSAPATGCGPVDALAGFKDE